MEISYRNVFAVFALGIVVACAPSAPRATAPTQPSSAAPATSIPANPPTVASPTVEPEPIVDPITVTVKVDQARAITDTVTALGGVVSATAADGTKYTLTVPAGALKRDKKVTVTPVTEIGGLPLSGGLLAAAQLGPEGLVLLEPATLTIDLPKPLSAEGELVPVAFGYHGQGAEFYLTPSSIEGTRITFIIQHFSGNGGALATKQDVARQLSKHAPTRVADRLLQDRAGRGKDSLAVAEEIVELRATYDKEIEPAIKSQMEGRDPTGWVRAYDALVAYQEWLNQVLDAHLEGKFKYEIESGWKLLVEVLESRIKELSDRCVRQDDIQAMQPLLQLHDRTMYMMQKLAKRLENIGGLNLPPPDYAALDKLTEECLRHYGGELIYKLHTSNEAVNADANGTTKIKLTFEEDGSFAGEGERAITYTAQAGEGRIDCGPFTVQSHLALTGQLAEDGRTLHVAITSSALGGYAASCTAHLITGDMTISMQLEPLPSWSGEFDIPATVGSAKQMWNAELPGGGATETFEFVTS